MPHASIRLRACANPDCARRYRRAMRMHLGAAAAALALACAAVSTAGAADWPRDDYNPQPADEDVILPMPCGGAMAFRKVVIPSQGPLSDRPIRIGSTDDQRGYIEGAHPAYVAGSFSAGDDARYFLIGKYEVSRLQYRALDAKCPTPDPAGRLPQTEVSWMDAIGFADRYSLWLLANAPKALPSEEKEPGFVRVPTEVEWEFAARGGIAVSESEFQERSFPMSGAMGEYVWFAGPQSANGQLQRIGLLKPNPLGVHDMLGNADEIVFDPFHLNKLDRLHGQAGGFIVRGGNFATAEDDIRAAYRQEIPYYQGRQPRRSQTTGFRLAVTAPVVTSRDRLQAIEDAWTRLGSDRPAAALGSPLGSQPLSDPIAELGVIASASADPNVQQRLKNLQLAFRSSFQARDEQRDRAAKARLRLGTFLCQKLRDDALPIDRMKAQYDACVKERGASAPRCQEQKTRNDAEEMIQSQVLNYYADTIVGLVQDYDETVIDQQLAVLREEFGARPDLKPLARVAERYAQHAAQFRQQKTITREAWLTQCKTL